MLLLARSAPRAARSARRSLRIDACVRGTHDRRPSALGEADPCCPAARQGRALRVVCCPPPAGRAPPCPAPPSPPPRTCSDYIKKVDSASAVKELKNDCETAAQRCGDQLDRVAHRISAVERARRLDYEREVAARAPPPPPAAASYRLADQRRCLRATDGRDYLVPAAGGRAVCGPGRTPPPPCPIEVHPYEDCEIHRDKHLDPCAHQPRIFVEIDRGDQGKSASPPEVASHSQSTHTQMTPISKPSEGLTTRILEKFKRGGPAAGSLPRKVECRRKDDDANCKVHPPTSSIRCGDPSQMRRLNRRPGESCGNSRREIHTKSKCNDVKSTKESSDKIGSDTKFNTDNNLEKILLERSQLKETGRGRTVKADSKDKKENAGTGSLELPVPDTADTVRVRVTLDFETLDEQKTSDATVSASTTLHSQTQNDSWLSLKNFHKKISGCRKREQIASQTTTLKASYQEYKKINDRCTIQRSESDQSTLKQLPQRSCNRPSNEKFSSSDPNPVSAVPMVPIVPIVPTTRSSEIVPLVQYTV